LGKERSHMDGIRITRELLDNYQKYKREIPLLEAELDELWTTEKGMGNSVILDYTKGFPRPQSIVGFDEELYKRRKAALQRKKEKVRAVEAWINAIEDGQTRCVFRMFYMDGMSWVKIAEKTGYSRSPDYPRLYIRDAYLKSQGIK